MRIRDVIEPWPPIGWITSFQAAEALTPNPLRAVVYSARTESGGVRFTVAEGDRRFSTILLLNDEAQIRRVTEALSSARGETLDEAGDQPLKS